MKYPFITYTCNTCCVKDSLSCMYANHRYLAGDDTTSVHMATQLGWCSDCDRLQPLEDIPANRRHLTQEIAACTSVGKSVQLQDLLTVLECRHHPICLTCGGAHIARVQFYADESLEHPNCGGRLMRDDNTLDITLTDIARFILCYDAQGHFIRRETPRQTHVSPLLGGYLHSA